jgi:hypothetical protein
MMSERARLLTSTRVVLHNVRLAYADQLITAKAFKPGDPEKYSCTLCMPPGHPGIEQLEAALEAAATKRWGKRSEWPKPLKGITKDPVIKECADHPKLGIKEKGWVFVRASSTEVPGIVDSNVEELNRADYRREVYSGRWATISVNAFAYVRSTGDGVSLGLGNIQLLKHDERLGASRPKPGEEFDPEALPDEDDDGGDGDFTPPLRRRPR